MRCCTVNSGVAADVTGFTDVMRPANKSSFLLFGRKGRIVANRTHSFLLVTETDVGDLLMLRFRWEEASRWSSSSVLKMVSSWWGADSHGADVQVHKIRVRAGETQQK